jgi:hypothetical protein
MAMATLFTVQQLHGRKGFRACDNARGRGSHFRRARRQEDGDDRLSGRDAMQPAHATCKAAGAFHNVELPDFPSHRGRATLVPVPRITYFVVLPFARDADGDFIAEAAIEVRNADQARSTASLMEGQGKGAVAFAKTGDPQLGEWNDAVILGRYGDVPDDLAAYTRK